METKKVIISKEYLERIRGFTAIRPDETFVYIPLAFRDLPEEMRPRFTLRPISGEAALRYSDSMRGEVTVEGGRAQVTVKRGEYTINVVRGGLLGWEGYYDTNGNVMPFRSASIENLPVKLLEELSQAITSRANLTEEEVLGLK